MHYMTLQEKVSHDSLNFPVEYHYVNKNHPLYNMSLHQHKEWELVRITDGVTQIQINEQMYTAQQGDILVIPDGSLHAFFPTECVYECLTFDLYALFHNMNYINKFLLPFYQKQYSPQILFTNYQEDIYPIVSEIMSAFYSSNSGLCELTSIINIGRLFTTILQKNNYTECSDSRIEIPILFDQLKPVLEYIEKHYSEKLSISDLAAFFPMNNRYFYDTFKAIMHQTPMEYVNYYRIEQAKLMLSTTDKSILEIGLECGFCDSSHFLKTFKKYNHMTPKEYRKLMRL